MDPNEPQRETKRAHRPRHRSRLSRSAQAQNAVCGQVCWFRCAVAMIDAWALYGPDCGRNCAEAPTRTRGFIVQSSREPDARAKERLAERADKAMRSARAVRFRPHTHAQ